MVKNEKHRQFLEYIAECRFESDAAAYRAVYPNSNENTSKSEAWKLKKRYETDLLEMCMQRTNNRLKYASPLALNAVLKIIEETKNEDIKLKAAKFIMEYAGHKPVERKEITISELTDEQLDEKLKALSEEVGLPVVH